MQYDEASTKVNSVRQQLLESLQISVRDDGGKSQHSTQSCHPEAIAWMFLE